MTFRQVIGYRADCDVNGCSESSGVLVPRVRTPNQMMKMRRKLADRGWVIDWADIVRCPAHTDATTYYKETTS